jgi:hypothetical protein
MTSSGRRSRLCFCLYAAVALVAIFTLPRLVGVRYVYSDSYTFGYNNRFGIALLLLFTTVGAVWAYRLGLRFPVASRRLGVEGDRVGRGVFWTCISIALVLCAGMYVLTARPGSFGESAYLINRIELVGRGLRPYRDFEYAYGAAFVYVPVWLSRLLSLSLPNAYYLFWLGNVLSGVWLLDWVLDEMDYPGRYRSQIFVMYCIGLFVGIVTTGVNYGGLRYFAGPALALLVCRWARRGGWQGMARAGSGVVAATGVLLAISPELGVAFGFGMAAYLLARYATEESRGWLIPYTAMVAGLAGLMWVAARLEVFRTLVMFAHGGINFPMVAAPHILMLFLAVFVGVSYLVFWVAQGRFETNTACLLAIAIPALPGALGHCDPGHVIFNGAVFFWVAFLWWSNFPRLWVWYRGAFVVVFIFFGTVTFLYGYVGPLSRTGLALGLRMEPKRAAQMEAKFYGKMKALYGGSIADQKLAEVEMMSSTDATKDEPWQPEGTAGVVEAPFGYSVNQNPTYVDEGYFAGLTNAFDPESIATKIEELKEHPDRDLVIPQYANCTSYADGERKFISVLFVYPFRWRVVHGDNFYGPLCRYILGHYELRVPVSIRSYGYTVWSPR